ncbi:MAG: aminopeptidase [Gammaproteobacteria bacterium]|jgi:predicted aminopeptidase|nr:aminopeptidase [Gammaproteobacteria bacterium]
MRWLISIPLLFLLGGCADIGYYWHSASGHLELMSQRSDIGELLADNNLDSNLRARLLLVQDIRRFSIDRLHLPANGSYSSYVALQQPYVIQNLFAAPEFSTRLHQWCYPVIGCASYRGYFDATRLRDFVEDLQSRGLEVHVGRVPAYSTLGWFDDPVLSSFIDWPDYRLAGLLFHELTHQQIYLDDDTTFNESLASAVQQVGTLLWLQANNQIEEQNEFRRWLAYRDETITLIAATRSELGAVYASDITDAEKRVRKARQFQQARDEHDQIAARHGIEGGFKPWFADGLNNAKIGSIAAYNSRLNAFIGILNAHAVDFSSFYRYVGHLAELKQATRERCLDAWELGPESAVAVCPPLETRPTVDA